MTAEQLIAAVRSDLEEHGDPERAAQQQRYMKSELPYRGLAGKELKGLLRPHLTAYAPTDRESWEATVLELWDHATHREE